MVKYVRKTALGYALSSNTEATDVVISKEDYYQIVRENRDLKSEIDRFASKISETEQALKQAEQREKEQTKSIQVMEERERQWAERVRELNKQLETKKCELAEAQKEITCWKGLNDNLLRISKERANAKRGLTPKKNHSGFQVTRSEERRTRYSSGGRHGSYDLRETFIQTPYGTDLGEEYIRGLLEDDLKNLLPRLGITENFSDDYKKYNLGSVMLNCKDKGNGILQWTLHANYKLGFWELHILHTKPIDVVPEDMRPSAKFGSK